MLKARDNLNQIRSGASPVKQEKIVKVSDRGILTLAEAKRAEFANRVDFDEVAHDLNLHFLPSSL